MAIEDLPRRRGRPRVHDAEARRQALVDCAFLSFIEAGFAGTTMESVAARARVSKRTLYELFANKVEMFAAVVAKHRHLVLDLPRPPAEPGSPLERLTRVFRLDMDRNQDEAREALLNLIVRESVQVPDLSSYLYDNGVIRFREDLIDWLQAEASAGTMVVADAPLCAGMLMDVVFGALLPRRKRYDDVGREVRKDDIRKRLVIVLAGLTATGPQGTESRTIKPAEVSSKRSRLA